jgi:hypothetical protein
MAYTYSKIATYTVGSGGISVIDFLAIPQTYTDLIVMLSLRDTSTGPNGNIIFNNSSVSYSFRALEGYTGGFESYTASTIQMPVTRSTATSNTFSNISIYIPNYSSGTQYKSVSIDGVTENNTTATNTTYQRFGAGLWSNTAPITQIEIKAENSFAQYSTVHLYGIKAEL